MDHVAWLADPTAPDSDPWNDDYYGYSLWPMLGLTECDDEVTEASAVRHDAVDGSKA
jgi:hypothetical protein